MDFRDFLNVATKTGLARSWKRTWLHQMDENVARGTSKDEERREAYLKRASPQQMRERVWQWNTGVFSRSHRTTKVA